VKAGLSHSSEFLENWCGISQGKMFMSAVKALLAATANRRRWASFSICFIYNLKKKAH